MANLIANVDDPLVIAFNGQWGSGKTVFLKMWAGELRKAGFPVIYFDAFENDYVEDAFAALAREVVSLTESKEATGETIAKTFKKKAIELGKIIGKAGVKPDGDVKANKMEKPSSAKCRVFTASYGGDSAVIVKAVADKVVNYTDLHVNEGSEKREAEAYIAAYAKGGETVGNDFKNQDQALDKAFELCPEG